MKFLVYDLETKYGIPSPITSNIMKCCKGWTDYVGMGISIGSMSYEKENEIVSIVDGNPKSFYDKLIGARKAGYRVGGFNTKKFDDKLLTANGMPFCSDFDILEMIKAAAGFRNTPKGFSYSLDNVLKSNNMSKNGNGAMAPLLFQEKKYHELSLYVENDSVTEYKTLQLLLNGELIDPNTGRKLKWSL